MRYFFVLISVLTLVCADVNEGRDPYKALSYFRLGNGMQVYMLPDPKAENVQMRLLVGVGYDNETDKTYGLSHLVEHIVFRDRRVPHHDYLDYIKEEGGKDVNGFTARYKTGYKATIASQKGEWLVGTFASMLFDKNVSEEDLIIEKKALQTEIGEPRWYYRPLFALKNFFEFIMPQGDNIFRQDFSLPEKKKLPDPYSAQENNERFTLDEVMKRYDAYYYPANMKLFIAGDFDPESMRRTVIEKFGAIDKKGSATVKETNYPARLNGKPYVRFYTGTPRNYAYIGTKYILDDYRKYLIINSYTLSLAERLQQRMRNLSGKTYSVNNRSFGEKRAQVAAISFDGLAGVFSDNIATAEDMIAEDAEGMEESSVKKALKLYETRYYSTKEHDTGTLMGLIETARYLREEHNITDRSSYEIFKSITPELFVKTVSETFLPENGYKIILREYYFFPLESQILLLALFILFIFAYKAFYRYELKRKEAYFTNREIVFQRRVSSRFMGFLVLAVTFVIAFVSNTWLTYLLSKWFTGDPYFLRTIDAPWDYLVSLSDFILFTAIFLSVFHLFWRYYARIVVTKDSLIAIGSRILPIGKEQIKRVGVANYRDRKFKNTIGTAFRFYKPLTEVELNDGRRYFIRNGNAEHLREDIESWLERNEENHPQHP